MEARAASDDSPSYQNASRKLQYEAQERQDGLSVCPNGWAKGSWQPNLLLQVFPKANLSSPRNLRDGFGRSQDSYLGGSSINFKQTISFHMIPCTPFHFIPTQFHSILFHSIPSIPFNSISIPIHSFRAIPFYSIPFNSTLYKTCPIIKNLSIMFGK